MGIKPLIWRVIPLSTRLITLVRCPCGISHGWENWAVIQPQIPRSTRSLMWLKRFWLLRTRFNARGPWRLGWLWLRPVFHILIVACSTTKPVFGGLTSNNTTKLANMVGFMGISWDNDDLPSGVIRRGLLENPRQKEPLGGFAGRIIEATSDVRFSSHVWWHQRVNHHYPIIIPWYSHEIPLYFEGDSPTPHSEQSRVDTTNFSHLGMVKRSHFCGDWIIYYWVDHITINGFRIYIYIDIDR